jgi:hypothetical protein
MKKIFRGIFVFAFVTALGLPASPVFARAQKDAAGTAATRDSAAVNAAYLSAYFGINIAEGVTRGDFAAALLKLQTPGQGIDELPVDSPAAPLTALDAVKYAVIGANLNEAALLYPEKAAGGRDAYAALAFNTGLIDAEGRETAAANKTVSADFAAGLLAAVAGHNGVGRQYLGYSTDKDIYQKFFNAWNSFIQFDDKTLTDIGVALVTNKVTTGYNLKSNFKSARFLPELTLTYGHSDPVHAQQLLAILAAEGISAKVAFEPKISIYQHMDEWGPTGEDNRIYNARKISDTLTLIYATEYDMQLEFADRASLLKFDNIILSYAKKNLDPATGEQEVKQLLAGSWWQPDYYTTVNFGTAAPDSRSGYVQIIDNVISHGDYTLHPFSLVEDAPSTLARIKALNPNVDIVQQPLYIDTAFVRYLLGGSD